MRTAGIVFVVVACGFSLAAAAREITVVPRADGSPLSDALAAAADGDTVRLAKGLYRETVAITKRITLTADAGAIIDPSQPFQPDWQPAPAIGPGVYRAPSKDRPYGLMVDGKFLAELDPRRTTSPGPWHWKTILAKGPPRAGFTFVRAIWTYRPDEKAIYLHLADDADPRPLAFSALWTRDAAVTFRGAAGARAENLTLARAYTGVAFTDGARDCTLARSVVGPFERTGVAIGGESRDCLVEHNQIFRGAYEDWTPRDNSRERYEIWQVHKLAGFYDRVGVNLFRAGAGNRVRANHIYETFDGVNLGDHAVESLDTPLTNPDHGRGTEIADNLIERTRDSGIELGVGCVDVRVHHNTLRQTHGGLRFKLPRVGPVFIYRNVLDGGSPFNIWYSMDDSPAEGYVYHNTIVGSGRAGVIYSSFNSDRGLGAPKWHYLNNLVATDRGFFARSKVKSPANFTADYNVISGGGRPWPDDNTKDQHSRYVDKLPLTADFHPPADSPAIDAGLDLSTYFHGKPLPGCEPRYFQGKAPDAGAFEVK